MLKGFNWCPKLVPNFHKHKIGGSSETEKPSKRGCCSKVAVRRSLCLAAGMNRRRGVVAAGAVGRSVALLDGLGCPVEFEQVVGGCDELPFGPAGR